jgi:hypothetical protein
LSQYLLSRQSAQRAICDTCAVYAIMTSDIEEGAEKMGDKMKAGAKTAENKARDAGSDVKAEYNKEKAKERMD